MKRQLRLGTVTLRKAMDKKDGQLWPLEKRTAYFGKLDPSYLHFLGCLRSKDRKCTNTQNWTKTGGWSFPRIVEAHSQACGPPRSCWVGLPPVFVQWHSEPALFFCISPRYYCFEAPDNWYMHAQTALSSL